MTMSQREMGFESTLYIRTGGTYGTPTWTELDLAKDVQDAKDVGEVEVTTRGIAKEGKRASQPGLTPWGFDFECLVPAAGETNSAYSALLAALNSRGQVDVLHVEGGEIDVDGLPAERGVCAVLGGGKGEPMEGAATRSFRVRFTPNDSQDVPVSGTTSSGAFVEAS